MSRSRRVWGRTGWVVITLAAIAGTPLAAAQDEVPASVLALLPAGAKLGKGSWAVFETEFGKTFGADMVAASFPGQSPTCAFGGTPQITFDLKGDTAWENPPMLEMAVAIHDASVTEAPAVMARYIDNNIKTAPDFVSIGEVHEEVRPNGYIVYVEYKENCTSRPNGAKTRLKGLARRGATQLEFNFLVASDGTAALAMAGEVLQDFEDLDIPALTQ